MANKKQVSKKSNNKRQLRFSKQNKILFIIATVLLVWNIMQLGIATQITGNATASGSLCLNSPPSISGIPNNQTNHSIDFFFNITATDANNENLSFSSNASFISFIHINNTTSTLNATTNISLVGTHNITIYVNDSTSCSNNQDTTSFLLTILNNAPINNGTIPNQSFEEDTSLESFNVSKYFTDPDNDTLTFTASTDENISVSIADNGTVTFSADTDFNGNRSIIFYANDTINQTASNNVTIEVTGAEDICGNLICELTETCSSCSQDCGSCSVESPGGGGRGSSFFEKGQSNNQQGNNLKENPSGTVPVSYENENWDNKEEMFSEDKLCSPNWVCSQWEPNPCKTKTIQTRSCSDTNNCDGISPELTKECEEQGFIQKMLLSASNSFKDLFSGKNKVGLAFSKGEERILFIGVIALIVFSLTIIGLILYINKKTKNKTVILSKERITTVKNKQRTSSIDIEYKVKIKINNKQEISIKNDFLKKEQ